MIWIQDDPGLSGNQELFFPQTGELQFSILELLVSTVFFHLMKHIHPLFQNSSLRKKMRLLR